MEILLQAALAMIVQMMIFLCLGTLFIRICKYTDFTLSTALLLGYFLYFSIFEILCLIFELNLLSLSALSLTMALVMGCLLMAGIVAGTKVWPAWLGQLEGRRKSHGIFALLPALALLATLVIVVLYTDASADSDYYVGMASTALFTNTLGRFEPTTGEAVSIFKARYAFCCYPFHNAVAAYLFRIPVVVQARTVMSAVNAIMANLAIYRLGRVLFTGRGRSGGKVRSIDRTAETLSRRRADIFVLAVFLVNLFSSTIYMPGIFLFSRSYEGKSLVVNICLPCALALCIRFIRESEKGEEASGIFALLFLVSLSGVCFSASSLFVFVLSLCGFVPYMIWRRKWGSLLPFLGGCSPVIIWIIVYYMTQHGMLLLRSVR